MSGSCDPRLYVCCDTEYFEDAICTFDRSFDCVYRIDSDFRGLHRVCGGKLFDLYGKSETGNFIYYSISSAATDRGNLIYPHVVGESVGLPSIWVLAAVTIGGNLMGIVGMLVFIPLLSVFYTIFREFVYLRLKKKHIKQVTKTEIEEYTAEEIVNSDISEGK